MRQTSHHPVGLIKMLSIPRMLITKFIDGCDKVGYSITRTSRVRLLRPLIRRGFLLRPGIERPDGAPPPLLGRLLPRPSPLCDAARISGCLSATRSRRGRPLGVGAPNRSRAGRRSALTQLRPIEAWSSVQISAHAQELPLGDLRSLGFLPMGLVRAR